MIAAVAPALVRYWKEPTISVRLNFVAENKECLKRDVVTVVKLRAESYHSVFICFPTACWRRSFVTICLGMFSTLAHPEAGDSLAVGGQDDVAGLDHGKRGGAGHAAPNF